MPRLRQVGRDDAADNVRRYYEAVFGDRDPVSQPGREGGTTGNYLTTFALVPYLFDHMTTHIRLLFDEDVSQLDSALRELALLRTGYTRGSKFVYSQHCKEARSCGVREDQITAISNWQVSDEFSPVERAVLSWADALVLEGGRASDDLFEALRSYLCDEEIFELTYHVMYYNLHAVCSKALRLEFDDMPERVEEVPDPASANPSDTTDV